MNEVSLETLSANYSKLPQRQKLSFLLIGSTIFLSLGIGLGFMLINTSVPPETNEISELPKKTPAKKTLSGKIIPLTEASIYMQGTHRLVDDEGNTLILLKAKDDKLKLAEGMRVEVEGVVTKTIEGDMEIMEVEKVRFR